MTDAAEVRSLWMQLTICIPLEPLVRCETLTRFSFQLSPSGKQRGDWNGLGILSVCPHHSGSSSDGLAPEDGLIPVACMMAQVFKESSKVDIAYHGLLCSCVNTLQLHLLHSLRCFIGIGWITVES